jgi:DNA-binding NtrC family response regulator
MAMSLTGTAEPITHQAHASLNVCVVGDDASMSELLHGAVERMGYPALVTTSPQEALSYIHAGKCQVVVSEVNMRGMDGLAFLDEGLRLDPGIHVILVTGTYSMDGAIEAIRRGAYDYLCKPLDQTRLRKTLDELTELHLQRRRIRELETRLL